VSPLDPEIAPAGEEIHLPGPTILPVLLTLGVTLALLGITTSWILWVPGVLLVLWVIVRWVRDARHEMAELPLEHSAHH
jgi:hypothetical protein